MTPGPTLYKKCSACSKPIAEDTVASGNTFGAVHWTDGKCEAPMLPDELWLAACPHCRALVWLDELALLGKCDWYRDDDAKPPVADALPYEAPSFKQYMTIRHHAGHAKERYVRVRAWWSGNDPRRLGSREAFSDDEARNAEALFGMLNVSLPESRLMKAELMRELGRYAEARELLSTRIPADFVPAADRFRSLAEQEDPFVARLSLAEHIGG